jgi:hypothetical protein
MITGADIKRATYKTEGDMIVLPSGEWRMWYRCEQFPRLSRCDELKSLDGIVTKRWFVDGIACLNSQTGEDDMESAIVDAIRRLMQPAPSVAKKQERVA